MAYTTINKSTDYFNTKLYTGNGGTNAITGVGFEPDMTWLKKRNGTANHHLVDAVRGVGYYLYPNLSNAQGGNGATLLTSFNSDGFTLDAGADSNASGATGVGWSWKAGNLANGQGSANTAGSINSTVSVNTTAGFSIVKYTGTGSLATVGHGLGVAPSWIITKVLTTTHDWAVYHQGLGNTSAVYLNLQNDKSDSSAWWNNTSPTSNVFTINTRNEVNQGSQNYISYCFAEKQGYSKFGSYTGNGNADGTFVYTGFKPAFVMTKKTSGTSSWDMHDTKRDTFNVASKHLLAEDAGAEGNTAILDILSNGFKFRSSNGDRNASGGTYIYMAFAEAPLVGTNNVPCTAR